MVLTSLEFQLELQNFHLKIRYQTVGDWEDKTINKHAYNTTHTSYLEVGVSLFPKYQYKYYVHH